MTVETTPKKAAILTFIAASKCVEQYYVCFFGNDGEMLLFIAFPVIHMTASSHPKIWVFSCAKIVVFCHCLGLSRAFSLVGS
jgi:hypothetical protein